MHDRTDATPIAYRRMRRANALVAAGVIAIALACVVSDAGHADDIQASGSLVKRIWLSMSAGSPMEDALEEAGIVKLTSENAPEWLDRELIGLSNMDQAITNDTFELFWFLRKGSQADASESIRDELMSKGWSSCGAHDGVESFVKGKGELTWAMAECAQAGDDVAIVLHTRHT